MLHSTVDLVAIIVKQFITFPKLVIKQLMLHHFIMEHLTIMQLIFSPK